MITKHSFWQDLSLNCSAICFSPFQIPHVFLAQSTAKNLHGKNSYCPPQVSLS